MGRRQSFDETESMKSSDKSGHESTSDADLEINGCCLESNSVLESDEHSSHEDDKAEGISKSKIDDQESLDLASKIKFFFMRVENDCFEEEDSQEEQEPLKVEENLYEEVKSNKHDVEDLPANLDDDKESVRSETLLGKRQRDQDMDSDLEDLDGEVIFKRPRNQSEMFGLNFDKHTQELRHVLKKPQPQPTSPPTFMRPKPNPFIASTCSTRLTNSPMETGSNLFNHNDLIMAKAKQLAAIFKGEILTTRTFNMSKNIEFRCCNGHRIYHSPIDMNKPIKDIIWCPKCLKFYQAA
mmetsp:Transcript_33795/g.45476  ORF Transcript_33795/g.45476 Transcript_33795/m.45476 type:complete len:296 (+) Transcript_33795:366-1253(+)